MPNNVVSSPTPISTPGRNSRLGWNIGPNAAWAPTSRISGSRPTPPCTPTRKRLAARSTSAAACWPACGTFCGAARAVPVDGAAGCCAPARCGVSVSDRRETRAIESLFTIPPRFDLIGRDYLCNGWSCPRVCEFTASVTQGGHGIRHSRNVWNTRRQEKLDENHGVPRAARLTTASCRLRLRADRLFGAAPDWPWFLFLVFLAFVLGLGGVRGRLVDATLRKPGELLIGRFLFVEGLLEQFGGLVVSEGASPCHQRAVRRHLVMLRALTRRDQAGVHRGA